MILLDTDILSATRRPERAPRVAAWMRDQFELLHLSVVTLGEVERGIERQRGRDDAFVADLEGWMERTRAAFAERVLPFGAPDALTWGRLSARLGHRGPDLMIAATALALGATVATRNVAHFEPTGVRLVNPFDA